MKTLKKAEGLAVKSIVFRRAMTLVKMIYKYLMVCDSARSVILAATASVS